MIRSVTANDYGDYICSGKNDQGEGHATVNLFCECVLYKTSEMQRQTAVTAYLKSEQLLMFADSLQNWCYFVLTHSVYFHYTLCVITMCLSMCILT